MTHARATAALALLASPVAVLVAACGPTRSTGGLPGGNYGEAASAPAGWPTEILEAHNRYRAAHCAPPLAWSPDIAAIAETWAKKLAANGCKLEHSSGDLGENLAGGTTGAIGAARSVELWYGERSKYAGGFSMQSGHFSQLVWKGSERLGCGTASCSGKEVFVCNYDPPGNVEGFYDDNVAGSPCK